MSRSRIHAAMLKHACTRCGAPATVWCKTKTGRWASQLHASRYFAALNAGDFPEAGQ
jgi:hypothetical protein